MENKIEIIEKILKVKIHEEVNIYKEEVTVIDGNIGISD